LRKGAGADDTASGATRVAGSLNFKDKYAPDFPTVQIAHSAPGLMASTGQLESMGLVAEPEKPAPPKFRLSRTDRIRSNKWPSYLRCVQGAPENNDNFATACNKCNANKSNSPKDEFTKKSPRRPVKGKYGEPAAWDGLSTLFVILAGRWGETPSASEREWLKHLKPTVRAATHI
jgi:hypothetical protein